MDDTMITQKKKNDGRPDDVNMAIFEGGENLKKDPQPSLDVINQITFEGQSIT